MIVCIAGKYQIAVDCTAYALDTGLVTKEDLLVTPASGDLGKDGFQKSFLKFCRQRGLKRVDVSKLYGLEDLVLISLQYDKLLSVEKFKTRRLFNVHFSLLPKYKGMYTSVWPILNGEDTSGVTLHEIDGGIDTGNIIDQITIPIYPEDTSRDLYLNYISSGTKLLEKNLESLLSGTYQSSKQSSNGSTYYSKRSIDFSNPTVDLNKTAFQIKNQIRAYCFEEFQLPEILKLKIKSAQILPDKSSLKAGTVINLNSEFIDLSTIDFNVRLFIA